MMDETLSGTSRHKLIFTWVVDLKCILISRELWSELMQIIFPVLLLLIGVPFPTFGETLDDLVKINGLYYKISRDIPFNGVIHGQNHGSFKNGSRHGQWVYHYDNGRVKSEGNYKLGKKEGTWVGYYHNGKIFYEGAYLDGIKEGLWVSFYDDEKVFYRGQYKAGKEDGPWIGFNPDGSSWSYRTGLFKNGVKVSN